jgi:hypothetical protein
MNYVTDGDLTPFEHEDIAEASYWEGNANELVNALVSCGVNGYGFLEQNDGKLFIHDWDTYIGKLLEKRDADRERKRKDRSQNKGNGQGAGVPSSNSPGNNPCPSDVHGVPGGQDTDAPQDVQRMSDGQGADAPCDGAGTVPTVPTYLPNQKIKTKDSPQSDASGGRAKEDLHDPKVPEQPGQQEAVPEKMATPCVGQPQDGETPEKIADMSVGYPPEFEEFWTPYPRKIEKKAAFIAWRNEVRTKADKVDLIPAVRHFASQMQTEHRSQDKIMHPEKFLHKDRWREWVTGPPCVSGSGPFNAPPRPKSHKNQSLEEYMQEMGDDPLGLLRNTGGDST